MRSKIRKENRQSFCEHIRNVFTQYKNYTDDEILLLQSYAGSDVRIEYDKLQYEKQLEKNRRWRDRNKDTLNKKRMEKYYAKKEKGK